MIKKQKPGRMHSRVKQGETITVSTGRTRAKDPDFLHKSYITRKKNCKNTGNESGGGSDRSPQRQSKSFHVCRPEEQFYGNPAIRKGLPGEKEPEPAEQKPVEEKFAEQRPAEEKPVEEKPVEEKSADGESAEQDAVLEETVSHSKPGKKKLRLALSICFLLLLGVAAGYFYYRLPYALIKDAVTIEAGETCPSVGEFLERENEKAYIVSGISEDMEFVHVEDIPVVIHLYHQDIATVLHVEDTTPPELETRDMTIMLGDAFALEDFVESVSDVTDYEISCQEFPDVQDGGMYSIIVQAKDEGGNITEKEAHLEVIEDVTPPVIEGVQEITVVVGGSVSYKRNVTVTDDYDEEVKLEIDNSQVDINTPGDYTVIYRAADKYGNKTEISTVLHVIEEKKVTTGTGEEIVITEETVNAEADKVLASITDPSMSQYEVIQAIYNWCNKKIAYVNGTPKSSWVIGAYYGVVERRGDCYAFAMASKCLLTRAGITNMDIERVKVGNSMHFWNLVDIGEGWRHFDTCRRGDGATFFYLTDAELMAYSEAHISSTYPNGTHYYDRTLYPVIP